MSSWKKALYSEGSMKEAIHNSIMGFTKCKNVNYTNETQFSIKLLDGDPYIVTSYGMLDNILLDTRQGILIDLRHTWQTIRKQVYDIKQSRLFACRFGYKQRI